MEEISEELSFWLRVNKVQLTGCWLWTGYINKKSMYGHWTKWVDGKSVTFSVHKYVYEMLVDRVPDGMELDHRCFVRFCCNPDHLEVVTPAVNKERRFNKNSKRDVTHCKKGHELSGINLRIQKNGKRHCRTCESVAAKARLAEFRKTNPPKKSGAKPKTHCPQGHPYDEENSGIKPDGSKYCKECSRQRTRDYRAKQDKTVEHRGDVCSNGHPFDEENTLISNGQRSCRICNRERTRKYRGSAAEPRPLSEFSMKYKTTCKNGHEWTEENTITTGLRRQCRACREVKSAK